jgi:hypothetical protein
VIRFLLLLAALGLALAVGYTLGVNRAHRPSATGPQLQIDTKATPPTPAEHPAPKAPFEPKPKAAPVAAQDAEAQVAEDAAAVGMTTREPEPATTIDELLRDEARPAPQPPD